MSLPGLTVTEGFVAVDGGKVFVKTWTPLEQKNVPLILLHDSLGCVATWKDLPEKLCDKIQRMVVAYDRLGFGRSSVRTDPLSLDFVGDEETTLSKIRSELKIDRFALLGYSIGGSMAVVFASRSSDKCTALITESAQAFVEDKTLEGIRKTRADFNDPELFAKLEKYHGEKTSWILNSWVETWNSPKYSNWSLKEYLPSVKCPLLAIHGDNDEYGSVAFPNLICNLAGGPAEKHIIQSCGHIPHREKPELIFKLITEFLAKN